MMSLINYSTIARFALYKHITTILIIPMHKPTIDTSYVVSI